MIVEKSLVLYKNRPARVTEVGEKITIAVSNGDTVRVREKDILLIHSGPVDLNTLEQKLPCNTEEIWELIEGTTVSLKELTELLYNEWTAQYAWATYCLLSDGLYFSGSIESICARTAEALALERRKRQEKHIELAERAQFLERLSKRQVQLPDDRHFVQDVEALALGQTDKSRTLKELGKTESPLEAHKLLLKMGFWTQWINPHPSRYGCALISPTVLLDPPCNEKRVDLSSLKAFAIDSPWSNDPDDAVSFEHDTVWVHIADPSSVVLPDSPADREARNRGATLYLPEATVRMLHEDAIKQFGLGLQSLSPALSFKITLNEDGSIAHTDIIRSVVHVTRLTYAEADHTTDSMLEELFSVAKRNIMRRKASNAVFIEFPDIHIEVQLEQKQINIEPLPSYRSSEMVRECMLLAGEGAAVWAEEHKIPFPFVSQESGDMPKSLVPGLAGAVQIRRVMRPRVISTKPGPHNGLGLRRYTQVTSPLRRYTDLLAHQQISAFLQGKPLISEEECMLRLSAAEASASMTVSAERTSRAHWIACYLADKKNSLWEATVMELRNPGLLVSIPALGIEAYTVTHKRYELNDTVQVAVKTVRIPETETLFTIASTPKEQTPQTVPS
ncbi:putative exoribonuclease II [Pillotina sp. SPG140]|jgi:exoribonuclease-2